MSTRSSSPSRPVQVATDGSALGNPGPGGWGWCVDSRRQASGGERHTTNNIMELVAIREALVANPGPLEILTDSQYAINCLTKWLPGWRRRGWKTSSGTPVKNKDLIVEIAGLLAGRAVTFTWVRGHNGHPLNEAADLLARTAAEARR